MEQFLRKHRREEIQGRQDYRRCKTNWLIVRELSSDGMAGNFVMLKN
jgi:hypothetical protein